MPTAHHTLTSIGPNNNMLKMQSTRARRQRITSALIHALPNELLAQIFYFAFVKNPCFLKHHHRMLATECLSHVCSRWRSITLSLSPLWSHIDIIQTHTGYTKSWCLARANILAGRAGDALLEMHLCGGGQALRSTASRDVGFLSFCDSLWARTWSLQLSIGHSFDYLRSWVLSCLSHHCVSGILTRFVVEDKTFTFPRGLIAAADGHLFDLELLPITILELDGAFFHWTSRAYHGLAELRLICSTRPYLPIPFTTCNLASILESSPGLRVLQVGLGFFGDAEEDTHQFTSEPIHLDHLEVLDLKLLSPDHQRTILSLILPGSKPLELFAQFPEGVMLLLDQDEFVKFFKRSNITRLHLSSGQNRTSITVSQLLRLVPKAQTLDLKGFRIARDCKTCRLDSSLHSQLHTLRIRHSEISLDTLQQVILAFSVSELILQACAVGSGNSSRVLVLPKTSEVMLLGVRSVAKITFESGNFWVNSK